jgi:MFS family permease
VSTPYFQICMSCIFVITYFQPDMFSILYPSLLLYYKISPEYLHYCTSAFYYGCALTVLFAGPLSEYIGEKKTFYIGLILILISIAIIFISKSVIIFTISRFIHGVGTGIPIVLGVSTLFNHLSTQQFKKAVYINNSLIMLAKAAAPLIGTFIAEKFHWKYVCLLISSATFLAIFIVKACEFKNKERNVNFAIVKQNYRKIAFSKQFIFYCIILALLAAPLTLFINTTPIIFVTYIKIDPFHYAYLRAIIMVMYALFGFIASHYQSKISQKNLILCAITSLSIGTILMNLHHLFIGSQIVILATLAIIFCSASYAILIPIYMAKAMSIIPNLSSYSSSGISFTRLLVVGLSTSIAGYFFNGTLSTLAIFSIVSLAGILALNYSSETIVNDNN